MNIIVYGAKGNGMVNCSISSSCDWQLYVNQYYPDAPKFMLGVVAIVILLIILKYMIEFRKKYGKENTRNNN
jgi:hypothetical protein